jgi:hypothetical protein
MATENRSIFFRRRAQTMVALLYLAGKFLAYSAWCYFGLRTLRPQDSRALRGGIIYGGIRLSLGLFFGILIYLLSSAVITSLPPGLPENVITYLAIYVPVRWVEWTILAVLILPGPIHFSEGIVGAGRKDRLWRLGGIGISCLADIPLIAALGGVIPVGRFLC